MNTVELVSGMVDQTTRAKHGGSSPVPAQPRVTEGDTQVRQEGDKQDAQVNERDLGSVVESLNAIAQTVRRQLEFSVDQDSGRTVIKIMDFDTQEVIRQIPPEELLRLSQLLNDAQGLIINDQA
ncbi:MAG: flagellar protein FlaG [Gammaproteobacteria bacterium]|nr:flagellar protein FlaG [Gammaproteobacteria bacterium]